MRTENRTSGSDCPWLTLSNGVKIPAIGLGCAQLEDTGIQDELISEALATGYRLFDNAAMYGNEALIGAALKRSGIDRSQILLSSKVHGNHQGYENTLRSFEQSLKDLKTDYLDLYFVHWPALDPQVTRGTWKAMEELYERGLVRALGISNYTIPYMEILFSICHIGPVINQVEFNPYNSLVPLRDYCAGHKIAVEGFFPLGGQAVGSKGARGPAPDISLLDNAVIRDIAGQRRKTPAQVILRWEIQSDVIVIPKTTKRHRIRENFNIFDFSLSPQEMERINGLNQDFAIVPDVQGMSLIP